QAYPKYEAFLSRLVSALDPLLDAAPVDAAAWSQGSLLTRLRALRGLQPLLRAGTSGREGQRAGGYGSVPIQWGVVLALEGSGGAEGSCTLGLAGAGAFPLGS
ncbi:pyridine nucleotide-disulfide oxidoreductase domain 2, partial [Chelydra serpentina]